MTSNSRRRFLQTIGAAGAVGTAALAGCFGVDDDEDDVEVGDEVPELQFVFPTSGSNPDRNELGGFISENLEELGFEVDRQELDFDPQIQQATVDLDFGLNLSGWGGTPERIDPGIFLYDMHHSSTTGEGGRNGAGYENPDYDEIAEAIMAETDQEARRELVMEAQEWLAMDQSRCYIANEGGVHPYNAERLESVNPGLGEGLNGFWNFMEAEPADDVDQVTFGYSSDIFSLNPMQDLTTPDRQFIRLLYDPLYRFDEGGIPTPWLAVDEPDVSDDGTTFTVEIREGHTFHDGEEVTTEDVKFSYELFAEYSPTYATYLSGVEDIETDGNEIIFQLEEPDATFASNALGQIYVFPMHIWEDIDDPVNEDDEDYIGSGPFQFDDWEREVEMQLSRFDDHFEPPNIERLIRVPGDEDALVDNIESYEIDMLGVNPTTTQIDRLEDDENIGMAQFDAVGHAFMNYNMRRDHYKDVQLRRAISHCVPKTEFVEEIRGGQGSVTHSPIAPAIEEWHNPDVDEFDGDLDAARETLEDAGYVWDSDGRIHYPPDWDDDDVQMFLSVDG